MRDYLSIIGIVISIIVLLSIFIFHIHFGEVSITAKVIRVIDGDTIVLDNGEKVRLLGVNAPERGQRYYAEAKKRLKGLVEGKMVKIELLKHRDQYGRLLGFVFLNSTNVNVEMVREGLSNLYVEEPIKYEKALKDAWSECLNRKINICNLSRSKCESCIKITEFKWNAEGNDCENPNGEYVAFQNVCNFSCNLTNWTIMDESRNVYRFKVLVISSGSKIKIHSGCGTDNSTDLYWCPSKSCKSIWNNNGDTLYLLDENGEMILNYNYHD